MAISYPSGAAILKLNTNVVLCNNSVTLDSSLDEQAVNCEATGTTNITTPGNHNWGISTSGVWRILTGTDITGQVTYDTLMALHLAKTEVDVEISPPGATVGVKYTGKAWIQSLQLSAKTNAVAEFSMTLKPASALARIVTP